MGAAEEIFMPRMDGMCITIEQPDNIHLIKSIGFVGAIDMQNMCARKQYMTW